MEDVDQYLKKLKIEKNSYNGITELNKCDIFKYINANSKDKEKFDYVEPFLFKIKTFCFPHEYQKMMDFVDDNRVLGYPFSFSVPNKITVVILHKNVKVVRGAHE